MNYLGDYINGQFIIAKNPSGSFSKIDPGDLSHNLGKIFYSINNLHKAVDSAHTAFLSWKSLALTKRISYIQKIKDEIEKQKKPLAEVISYEVGKPLWESIQEVAAMISKITISINEGLDLVKDFEVKNASGHSIGKCIYKPRGILGVLGPFNFPGHLPNGHFIPALLTGNSIIFKPSELTPFTGQMIAEIIHNTGLPKGVFNMVQGESRVASTLVSHDGIDGILFTGSYKTGLDIKKATLNQPWKIIALEMGGKNSTIVLDDAHLDFALHESLFSSLVTTGQRCTSTSKIILQKKIAHEFIDQFVDHIKRLKIGYAFSDNEPFMGPVISDASVQKFLQSQLIAQREGHEKILEGKRYYLKQKGHYITPAIFIIKGKNHSSPFQKDEIFAPNISFYIIENLKTGIDIANASDYRLVTSIFSKSEKNYKKVLDQSNSGLINWNRSTVGASSKLPFGGGGKSGNHFPTALFASTYCTYPVATLQNSSPPTAVDFSLFS